MTWKGKHDGEVIFFSAFVTKLSHTMLICLQKSRIFQTSHTVGIQIYPTHSLRYSKQVIQHWVPRGLMVIAVDIWVHYLERTRVQTPVMELNWSELVVAVAGEGGHLCRQGSPSCLVWSATPPARLHQTWTGKQRDKGRLTTEPQGGPTSRKANNWRMLADLFYVHSSHIV